MNVISLSTFDLSIAALLLIILALLSIHLKLGMTLQIIVAGIRTTVQLLLVGLVLKALFAHSYPWLLILIASIMLIAASREVVGRQKRKFVGWWSMGVGTISMCISSFTITLFALTIIIENDPWYQPQYAIPLLGMILGNTMTGIAVGLDRLTQAVWDQRMVIEERLMLGQTWTIAIGNIRRDSIRGGLIPIMNAMTVAGLVSLPGMMTGQILAGSPPLEAVKYQILIMFLVAGGTGLGTISAVWMGSRRLFDERQRLCLDRLK
ncbi:MAG: iron export ABC transporter permease subunit FetB [Desulfosarcina sp.]|nr:iron export ABC transporter permease subunit FetB [Desulfobacterales bacterium]